MIIGIVADSVGTPLDGGTVTPATPGASVYYQDTDLADGLFSTGLNVNTETQALAGAVYVIPAAPLDGYTGAAPGQTYTTIQAAVDEGKYGQAYEDARRAAELLVGIGEAVDEVDVLTVLSARELDGRGDAAAADEKSRCEEAMRRLRRRAGR